jgi:hypothetical protein
VRIWIVSAPASNRRRLKQRSIGCCVNSHRHLRRFDVAGPACRNAAVARAPEREQGWAVSADAFRGERCTRAEPRNGPDRGGHPGGRAIDAPSAEKLFLTYDPDAGAPGRLFVAFARRRAGAGEAHASDTRAGIVRGAPRIGKGAAGTDVDLAQRARGLAEVFRPRPGHAATRSYFWPIGRLSGAGGAGWPSGAGSPSGTGRTSRTGAPEMGSTSVGGQGAAAAGGSQAVLEYGAFS